MSPAEIEKLRAISRQWVKESEAAGVPNTAKTERAILRLLEERGRLLEALRGMRDQFDGMRDFVCPDGGAESVAAATDAIAFAEAPATGSKEV